ncbi:isocitrate lyase/PEP mutase family protein [Palleronia rufa]|uniref:isocitrate lyase/PEP mutase family protein n=1 Tax=Palleronia rufa TaxID=1530186 RepID=UPI00056C5B88|nr:isocitrate lyase/phosphoenolpyruvate mutase family protein [Palleronia rufa]
MTNQTKRAEAFRALHIPGNPLVLYNIWDAGGAKALVDAGAPAVATGSWSMAAAHGFEDGEAIPLDLVLKLVERITASVDCPVTVDFEGGYAQSPDDIAANVGRLIDCGAIGLNFEDQIVGRTGLHAVEDQVARLRAVRKAADDAGLPFFINARTDLFLKNEAGAEHALLIEEAIARQNSYAEAGADGYFIPGLTDPTLISRICEASTLPVNVMMMGALSSVSKVASLGVARASYGPGPYIMAMKDLVAAQSEALAS